MRKRKRNEKKKVDQKSNGLPSTITIPKRLNVNIKYCLLLSFWSVLRNRLTKNIAIVLSIVVNVFFVVVVVVDLFAISKTNECRTAIHRCRIRIHFRSFCPFRFVYSLQTHETYENIRRQKWIYIICSYTCGVCGHENPNKLQFNKRINYIITLCVMNATQ